jgi:hypothetical protein
MVEVAYELGVKLAESEFLEKNAKLYFPAFTPKGMAVSGLGVGAGLGMTGAPWDPNRDHNKPGLVRGAAQGLGAGAGAAGGAMLAKQLGMSKMLGIPMGLLGGYSLAKGLTG